MLAVVLVACTRVSTAEAAGSAIAFTDTVVTAAPDGAADDDRVPAAADSTRRGIRARRVAPSTAKPSRFSQPRWVMLRSLVVPGWGQAANGAWLKAGVIAAGEGLLVWKVVDDQRELNRLAADVTRSENVGNADQVESAIVAYNHKLDAATTREYLLGAVVLYSLVDAYVDAHFRHFKIDFETDPALPDGPPPGTGARVGWEWRF
jgi:hypothetical protein